MQPTKKYYYAHNPQFCMIMPDADEGDEDIVSGSQS